MIPLKNAMITWTNPSIGDEPKCEIIYYGKSDNTLPNSFGACNREFWEETSSVELKLYMMECLWRIVLLYKIPKHIVHAAFMNINEYKELYWSDFI